MMNSMRDTLVKLGDGNVQGNDRSNYTQQYASMLANLKTFIQDASYNNKTLIGDLSSSNGSFASRGSFPQRKRIDIRDRDVQRIRPVS